MAQLLDDIAWGEPNLVPAADAAVWEAEIRRRGGRVSEIDRRVATSPWLREACLDTVMFRPSVIPMRLFNIGLMVTSQENACRYCYGANRAYMKILGYPESFISRIERDVHMAELDDRERGFIAFCRKLARSRPRPARADRDALVALGYAPLAVHEMALLISVGCFYNRIGILMACPPELGFERMANGWAGRVIGLAGPLIRRMAQYQAAAQHAAALDVERLGEGAFGPVLLALAGLPGAAFVKRAIDGALASDVLPRSTKALMFAVVAHTLGCPHCAMAARALLEQDGFAAPEIDAALMTLDSERLPSGQGRLLSWVRDTVHYQTAVVQGQTRDLASRLSTPVLLEAIGVAALANGMVRLAMLLE